MCAPSFTLTWKCSTLAGAGRYVGIEYTRINKLQQRKVDRKQQVLICADGGETICTLYSINVDYVHRRGSSVYKATLLPYTITTKLYIYIRKGNRMPV